MELNNRANKQGDGSHTYLEGSHEIELMGNGKWLIDGKHGYFDSLFLARKWLRSDEGKKNTEER